MERRKILLYTHALTGGGAERVWALLASGLARRGHDVLLVTDFAANENAAFVDASVRQVVLGGGHALSVLRFMRLLAREKPDVSISALSVSNLKHAAAAFLAGRLKRAILSFHGYSESEPKRLSRLGYIATAVVSRVTAASVCVSDGLRDYVAASWHGDQAKLHRIYNPVDPGPGQPAASEAELLARGPVALAAGRLVEYKNFPGLVRAFAKVEPADARLIIMGQGEEHPKIEAEIQRLGLQDRVRMAGYVPEPWAFYRQARCFVLPSRSESFGLVVVEALGNGLPVVSTDCHGPREILANGEFGALTPQGDEGALAAAITRALAAPGDPAPRIARAREFSIERGLDEYEALIARVIRADSSGGGVEATGAARRRKIFLYTHSLAGGGAERAMALLASGLARRGNEVVFATDFTSRENDAFLDAAVRRVDLGRGHARATLRLAALLRQEQPDISLSGLGACNLKNTIAACLAGRRKSAVLAYHGFFESEPRPLSRLSFLLTPLLTRLTGRTVAVSGALRDNLVGVWRGHAGRTRHLHNPVYWGAPRAAPTVDGLRTREKTVLACGRLAPGKNFMVLLRAFAQVEPADARLVVIGEGPERGALEAEIARLGLTGRVDLPGYVAEPWSYYERAACLAVSSRSESFGMVIVEGLAHGLPIVATDCGGPREILHGGELGRLVPIDDAAALACAINAALADPGDPAPRVERARAFSQERSVAAYETLFDEMRAGAPAMARMAAPGSRF